MQDAKLISGGSTHFMLQDSAGFLFCCGWNARGQMGPTPPGHEGTNFTTKFPFEIQQLDVGQSFSLFLDVNGIVWSCGWNAYGQLGHGDFLDRSLGPVQIPNLPPIEKISVKYNHSLALDEDGCVWGFGWNAHGQLAGCTVSVNVNIPAKFESLPKIQAIAAGYNHSLFLDFEGDVWGCGELSVPNSETSLVNRPFKIENIPKIIQISCGSRFSLLLDFENNVWSLESGPSKKIEGLPAIHFVASNDASFCLDFEGNVWTNYNCGSPCRTFQMLTSIPKIRTISCGNKFFHFVDTEGSVWGCGNNNSSQLGISTNKYYTHTPVKLPNVTFGLTTRLSTKSARNVHDCK